MTEHDPQRDGDPAGDDTPPRRWAGTARTFAILAAVTLVVVAAFALPQSSSTTAPTTTRVATTTTRASTTTTRLAATTTTRARTTTTKATTTDPRCTEAALQRAADADLAAFGAAQEAMAAAGDAENIAMFERSYSAFIEEGARIATRWLMVERLCPGEEAYAQGIVDVSVEGVADLRRTCRTSILATLIDC